MSFIQYGKQTINDDDLDAVVEVLKSNFLTTGPKIEEFENLISNYTGAKYCIAVSSGTAALHLVSKVLLSKNDKVLTTPNSFLATSNSVLLVGAHPIFVDIERNGNIDLNLCEDELKRDSSIKALYVVAFSGHMVDQKKLKYLKETYDIIVVEDCAHSLGASEEGIKAGSCVNSDASIFSFHPVKHITTGEGGMITTNSKELYENILLLRNHGIVKNSDMNPWEYEMKELGFNYRITDIQCALGISQLSRIDSFIAKRIEIAKIYDKYFINTIVKPLYFYDKKSSYHLYVVQVDFSKLKITKRELFEILRKNNIAIQVHYIAINKQPYYKKLGYGNEITPVMDKYYKECISLPMYVSLSIKEVYYVINNLLKIIYEGSL